MREVAAFRGKKEVRLAIFRASVLVTSPVYSGVWNFVFLLSLNSSQIWVSPLAPLATVLGHDFFFLFCLLCPVDFVRKTSENETIAGKKTDTQKAEGRGAGNTRGHASGACFVAKTQQQQLQLLLLPWKFSAVVGWMWWWLCSCFSTASSRFLIAWYDNIKTIAVPQQLHTLSLCFFSPSLSFPALLIMSYISFFQGERIRIWSVREWERERVVVCILCCTMVDGFSIARFL
jgi:hypothetical protein